MASPDQKIPSDAHWLTHEDIPLLAQATRTDEGDIRRCIAENHRAVVYTNEDGIVGVNWCVPHCYHGGWTRVRLPPRSIWKSHIWVAPAHRGRGIAGILMEFRDAALFREGFEFSFNLSDILNTIPRKRGEKTGVQTVGKITYIRLFDFTLLRFRDRFHFGRWSKDRPFDVDLSQDVSTD